MSPTSAGPARRPLSGIRVLDFTRVLAGPYCARALADLGAEVIKIEPPDGDLARTFGPRHGHLGLYFLQQNAGKRNVSLDLRTTGGRRIAAELAARCDVVLENFRPGVMARYGLDYPALAADHPELVYVSISGYGQTGPARGRAAYAAVIHAEAGLTDLHARRCGEDSPFEAMSHADVYAGLHALSGALAALWQRERTGAGQHVDVAMAASLLHVDDRTAVEAAHPGQPSEPPGLVLLRTRTGRRVVVSGEPTLDRVFAAYVAVLGRPDLPTDPRFADRAARRRNRAALVAEIQAWADTVDPAELERVLGAQRLPLGEIRSVREMADSRWAAEYGAFAEVDDRAGGTVRVPHRPWRFSAAETGVRGSAAFRGEHNGEVLGELLGTTEEELAELRRDGVLSARLPAADGDEPTTQEALR